MHAEGNSRKAICTHFQFTFGILVLPHTKKRTSMTDLSKRNGVFWKNIDLNVHTKREMKKN